MYNLLLTLLLVMSAIIVIAVFMQPQKNPSSNVFDGGGAEALFERSKPRGFETFMQRFTGIMVFLWIVDAIVLSILSSK
ncbi:preprotein translocase subunit SecG [Streptococcus thermophilus]|uniref:preprotein translocase subunit SecG n=1 Tax=Streptococcus thermophilus TaxID=1308 RepID=UPI0022EAA992|nr:preprotein translocase subunit SecG [Streptococcus thermophilus]MDA3775796.1 preprotein translocase subunit SecG [Streptococcus thermophilus]